MRTDASLLPRLALAGFLTLVAPAAVIAARPDDRPAAPAKSAAPAAPDAARVLDRVVAIGASATAGFGVLTVDRSRPELGSFPVPLAAAIGGSFDPRVTTVDLGSGFFFREPSVVGKRAVEKAMEIKPSCVVAVDFLFWFLYGTDDGNGGRLAGEGARLDKLELGLALLDLIPPEIPLVVGDIPDMRTAIGKMLSAAQVPTPETIAKANERVIAWIAKRPNALHFRLADTCSRLSRGEPVTVAGVTVTPRPNAPLLQTDRLHPNFRGTVTLGLQVADTLATAFGPPVSARVIRDETVASTRTRTAAGEREAERRANSKVKADAPPGRASDVSGS